MELHLENVSKSFRKKRAVDKVTLTLPTGVNGLLGANGAGKTTLLRLISGVLTPEKGGRIEFNGHPVSSETYRSHLGYLPQDFGYYPNFTGRDFLLYLASLKGLPNEGARLRSAELLKAVSLEEMADKKIKTYSGGMKQRLGIAQALLNRPKLLVLDEPTVGLDPKERRSFKNLIGELGKNSVILLSTHIVTDIEDMADKVLMMKDGRIIYESELNESNKDLERLYMERF